MPVSPCRFCATTRSIARAGGGVRDSCDGVDVAVSLGCTARGAGRAERSICTPVPARRHARRVHCPEPRHSAWGSLRRGLAFGSPAGSHSHQARGGERGAEGEEQSQQGQHRTQRPWCVARGCVPRHTSQEGVGYCQVNEKSSLTPFPGGKLRGLEERKTGADESPKPSIVLSFVHRRTFFAIT